jgi:hypothetical protein
VGNITIIMEGANVDVFGWLKLSLLSHVSSAHVIAILQIPSTPLKHENI